MKPAFPALSKRVRVVTAAGAALLLTSLWTVTGAAPAAASVGAAQFALRRVRRPRGSC